MGQIVFTYFLLLFVFYTKFTEDKSASRLIRSDWVVLLSAPAVLIGAYHYIF
jgi:ABC-type phosphate transport system permease subunit